MALLSSNQIPYQRSIFIFVIGILGLPTGQTVDKHCQFCMQNNNLLLECLIPLPQHTNNIVQKWIFNGKTLAENNELKAEDASRYNVTTTSDTGSFLCRGNLQSHARHSVNSIHIVTLYTLQIQNLLKEDEGVYNCIVHYYIQKQWFKIRDNIKIKNIAYYLPPTEFPQCSIVLKTFQINDTTVRFSCVVEQVTAQITLNLTLQYQNGSSLYLGNISVEHQVSSGDNGITFYCHMMSETFPRAHRECFVGPVRLLQHFPSNCTKTSSQHCAPLELPSQSQTIPSNCATTKLYLVITGTAAGVLSILLLAALLYLFLNNRSGNTDQPEQVAMNQMTNSHGRASSQSDVVDDTTSDGNDTRDRYIYSTLPAQAAGGGDTTYDQVRRGPTLPAGSADTTYDQVGMGQSNFHASMNISNSSNETSSRQSKNPATSLCNPVANNSQGSAVYDLPDEGRPSTSSEVISCNASSRLSPDEAKYETLPNEAGQLSHEPHNSHIYASINECNSSALLSEAHTDIPTCIPMDTCQLPSVQPPVSVTIGNQSSFLNSDLSSEVQESTSHDAYPQQSAAALHDKPLTSSASGQIPFNETFCEGSIPSQADTPDHDSTSSSHSQQASASSNSEQSPFYAIVHDESNLDNLSTEEIPNKQPSTGHPIIKQSVQGSEPIYESGLTLLYSGGSVSSNTDSCLEKQRNTPNNKFLVGPSTVPNQQSSSNCTPGKTPFYATVHKSTSSNDEIDQNICQSSADQQPSSSHDSRKTPFYATVHRSNSSNDEIDQNIRPSSPDQQPPSTPTPGNTSFCATVHKSTSSDDEVDQNICPS